MRDGVRFRVWVVFPVPTPIALALGRVVSNPCWSCWRCSFGERQKTIPTPPPPFEARLIELGSDLESGVCTAGKVKVNGGTSSQDDGSSSGVVKSGNDNECRTVVLCGFLIGGCCCAEEVCRNFLRRNEEGILRMDWRLVGK